MSLPIECEGDVKVRQMLEQIRALQWTPTAHQMAFMRACIAGCLPQIYGDDWEANRERVLREWNAI